MASTAEQISTTAVGVAGSAVAGGIEAGSMIGLGLSVAWIPVIGAAVAAVTLGIHFFLNRPSARQKVIATKDVEEVERRMVANRDAYLSGPRTKASQMVALQNYDALWNWLKSDQLCGNPELGDAGRRCIAEREHENPEVRWDYQQFYRDPIATDAQVIDSPIPNSIAEIFPNATAADIAQYTKWAEYAGVAGLILFGAFLLD